MGEPSERCLADEGKWQIPFRDAENFEGELTKKLTILFPLETPLPIKGQIVQENGVLSWL